MIRIALNGADHELRDSIQRRLHRTQVVDDDSEAEALVFLDAFRIPAPSTAIDRFPFSRSTVISLDSLQSRTDLERTLERADSHPVLIESPLRYQPSLLTIQRQSASGCLGDPGLLRLHRWLARDTHLPHSSHSAMVSLFARRMADLDLVLWLMDDPPERVFCSGDAVPTGEPVADTSPEASALTQNTQIHCGWSGGSMAIIDFADISGREEYFSLMLIGSAGSAWVDDHNLRQLMFTANAPGTSLGEERIPALTAMVQAFVDSLASRGGPADRGQSELRGPRHSSTAVTQNQFRWRQALKLLDLAEQSRRLRRAVAWKEA